MAANSAALRPAGMLEKLYTARQVLGIYHSVIITASYTYHFKLDNKSLHSIFCTAISRLLHQHAPLCCYVEGERTAEPVFRRLDTLQVEDVLQISTLAKGESLAVKLQDLHDQPWDWNQKPLWKLVVLEQPETDYSTGTGTVTSTGTATGTSTGTRFKLHVAFVYHHAIGDGLSGVAFHRSLLQELEIVQSIDLDERQPPQAIDVPTSVSLIEPIEKLVTFPLSWPFLVKQVVQEYAPRWIIGAPSPLWAGLTVQTIEDCPLRSRIGIVAIPDNEVQKLLKQTKEHNVSLTSLLTASIVSALAYAIPEASRLIGITPYTLRRVTRTSMDEMVNQTSGFETSYEADLLNRIRKSSNDMERRESLWQTASYFHSQMQDELARCPRDNVVGLLPYVSDHINFYRKKIGRAREATWEVSNVGVVKTSQVPRSWKLEGMTFTQGAAPVGPAFAVNCASVKGGPLTLAISWQDSIIGEDIIDAVNKSFGELANLLG